MNDKINELVVNNLKKIIFIIEKEQILSTFCNNPKIYENEIIKSYINDFVSKINCEENNTYNWTKNTINKKIIISILYNQKLPFTENIFTLLNNYIQRNISSKYLKKDTIFITTKIKEEQVENEFSKYLEEIKNLDNNLKIELYNSPKYKFIIDILDTKNKELISYLFEDYFYYFFKNNKNLLIKYDILSKILNILIQFRLKTRKNKSILDIAFINEKITLKPSFIDLFEEDEFTINNDNDLDNKSTPEPKEDYEKNDNIYLIKFISIINFIQSYSKEIYMILELCSFLLESNESNINQNFSDNNNTEKESLYKKIEDIIQNQIIKIEDSERNPDYKKFIKVPFFYIIEPLAILLKDKLYNILNNINYSNSYKKLKNKFFNEIHYHVKNLLKLERRFFLFSKEIFSLDIISEIINKINLKLKENNLNYNSTIEIKLELLKPFLIKNENNSKNELIQINENKKKEKENEELQKWIAKIQLENISILKIFEDNKDEYSYLMNKMLLNYFKGDSNKEKGRELIEKVLFNKKVGIHNILIKYSYPILQIIFGNIEPKYKDNIKLLAYFNEEDEIKKYINIQNELELNEILLYRFEIICDNYFNKILNDEKSKIDINQRLCEKISKKYLIEAANYFYEQKYEKLKNICNIYCIAFIKRYLNYFIDILLDNKRYHQLGERKDIIKHLFCKDSNTIKRIETIKYYVLKLFYKKKDWEYLIKYFNINEEDKFGFKEYNCFKIYLEKDDSLLNIPILLLDNQNKENQIYNEILSKNNLDKENRKIFFDLFLKDNINENLYDVLSNIVILFYNVKGNQKYLERKNNYTKLLSSIIKYLNEEYKSMDKDILSFINLIFEEKYFNEKIKQKIGLNDEISDQNKINKITILLYALRFIFLIILNIKDNRNNPKGFYKNLITKNIYSIIEKNFIPGILEYKNLKIHLKKEEEKIREMEKITYIFLHFIIHSFLFYSNIQGFLLDKYLNKYIIDGNTCFDIIEKDWELMKDNLGDIDIGISLNLIFNDIIKKINLKAYNNIVILLILF